MIEKSHFRDPELTRRIIGKIAQIVNKSETVRICHVCGTHEWTITHFGLRALLPSNVEVIAGPGCPVCIIPASEIDEAVQLALGGVTIICFGDVLRVPGSRISLLDSKAQGADVRVVYSISDAVMMARKESKKEFVFFAVGFETTTPATAVEILNRPPRNLSFLVSHRVIPPAMKLLAEMPDLSLNGFIAPGHVSTIIGFKAYKDFPESYRMPTVVVGFEPLDVLFGIYMILKQLRDSDPRLENEYTRAVTWNGNVKAQELMQHVFETGDGDWRGLGMILASRTVLKGKYSDLDAHRKYGIEVGKGQDIKQGCSCHLVIIGKIRPIACPLFMKACTPQNPVGACMVSIEGTCRIWAGTEDGSTADLTNL